MYTALGNMMTDHCAANVLAAVSSCAHIVTPDTFIFAVSAIFMGIELSYILLSLLNHRKIQSQNLMTAAMR